jgi:hypothetical protein
VNYLRLQRDLKRLERLEKQGNGMTKSKLFSDTREISPEELDEIRTIEASGIILKKAHQEFIAREREELRERKILGLAGILYISNYICMYYTFYISNRRRSRTRRL